MWGDSPTPPFAGALRPPPPKNPQATRQTAAGCFPRGRCPHLGLRAALAGGWPRNASLRLAVRTATFSRLTARKCCCHPRRGRAAEGIRPAALLWDMCLHCTQKNIDDTYRLDCRSGEWKSRGFPGLFCGSSIKTHGGERPSVVASWIGSSVPDEALPPSDRGERSETFSLGGVG